MMPTEPLTFEVKITRWFVLRTIVSTWGETCAAHGVSVWEPRAIAALVRFCWFAIWGWP
jgi:hypothetical protein